MLLRRILPASMIALSWTPAALAQTSDADRANARALAQQGQDALDRKDFAAAADRFTRAAELVHAPTLELGLARARVGLGAWIAAEELYNRILHETLPAGAPPAFVRAVADARKELDALEPRIPSVVITVKSPAAPKVTLDGVPVPSALLGVNRLVDPGKHVVHAEAEGFASEEATITIAEHRTENVTIVIARPLAAAAPSPPAPPPVATPSPEPKAAPPPAASTPSSSSLRKTLGFVGIGVGGAGLVIGAAAGGVAIGKHGNLAKLCPTGHCINQQDAIDSYHVMTSLSTAGFVVGGVFAAAGVVLVVTAPKQPARDAWLAPMIAPGFAGAQGGF